MQGQKNTITSVPENVDINVGPFPLTDSMAQQTYLSNRPNQEGLCSSSYASSSESSSSSSSHAAGSGGDSFNAWSFGQPSFAANWEGRQNFDGMKMEQDWPSSICASAGAGPSSAARQLELHHNVLFPETAVPQNPPANRAHQNNSTAGPNVSSFPNLESERGTSTASLFGNSSHLSGSSSHIDGRTGGSSSSMAAWGSSSCKRKALEGTSGQSNPSASSSSIPQTENFGWHNETLPHGNSPDLMNSSPASSWNSPSANRAEHLSTSTGLTVRGAALEPFPPLGITMGMGNTVAPRSFDRRGSSGPQQEPFPFNLASLGSSRHRGGFSLSHGPGLSSSFLDVRSTRAGSPNAGVLQTSQLNPIQAPQLPSNSPGYTWIGAQHSRSSNFAGSSLPAGSRDEANSGSLLRYISETPVVSSAAEARNMGQDPTSWDLAAGLTSHRHSNLPSSRRNGQSSASRQLLPPFVTPRSMSPEIRRVLEWAPWAPESFDGQNSHIPAPSSSSGSSSVPQLSGGNSLGRRQQYHRPGFSADNQGDELLAMSESPLRSLTGDVERRNRVIAEIRQVLSAMRRGENLRAEDYMIFEPLMFQGLAEIHDRHREMRLDVDNMSYEELLELEERIGDVSTGLNEETIMKFLRRHKKQIPTGAESVKDLEPCCICQEQYVDGEEMGGLDCGHDFHVDCIKQWLTHKNLCPICKTTGLVT